VHLATGAYALSDKARVAEQPIPTRRELSVFRHTRRTMCVPANLIPYVRSGLIAEFASATDVLEDALAGEPDPTRWCAGLAQLDCARELLSAVGLSPGSGDVDLIIEVESPRMAQMLLDALRAVYEVEVERLANATAEQHQNHWREVLILRNFIVDVEQRIARAAKRQMPILDLPEKRAPRSVRSRG
jgi:hypothetical protein